jgi:hypothetical protein
MITLKEKDRTKKFYRKLEIIHKSANIANIAIFDITNMCKQGEIAPEIAGTLVNGIIRSLKSREISSKLRSSNNISITISHNFKLKQRYLFHFDSTESSLTIRFDRRNNNFTYCVLLLLLIVVFFINPFYPLMIILISSLLVCLINWIFSL